MQDLRKKSKLPVKGHFITSGYKINEESVKQMLQFMGVESDDTLVQEAIGFISARSMELNISNLHEYLQSKSIMSSLNDSRKKK